jgi:uncharacterized protein (TIGR03435 family)
MSAKHLALLLAFLFLAGTLPAQEPSFEVASIRANPATTGNNEIRPQPNGRFTATGATLRSLILRAYALHESQLIAAPDWIGVERFDIDARAATPPLEGPEALLPMLRALLTERFRLRMHPEMRELPAFVLTHARRDRTLGPQIRPTEADCSGTGGVPTETEVRAAARDGWPPCGMVFVVSFTTGGPDGVVKIRFRRSAITMKDFAPTLQAAVDRPVLDRTALEGRYDLEYSYAPRPNTDSTLTVAQNVPLLGAALEEQLGLKLESERTEVPVFVIDSVDRPSEN